MGFVQQLVDYKCILMLCICLARRKLKRAADEAIRRQIIDNSAILQKKRKVLHVTEIKYYPK